MPKSHRNVWPRLGCGCGKNLSGPFRRKLGQVTPTDPYGYDSPTNYDEYYNTASATAENLWNDVESVGVWAGNQLTTLGNDFLHPGNIPGNPIQQGQQAAGQSIWQDIGDAGQSIENAFSGGFNKVLLLGGIAIIGFALLERK